MFGIGKTIPELFRKIVSLIEVVMLMVFDVEEEIRLMHVSNKVSEVAAVSAVRKFLVQQQQIIGKEKGIVMDGRDVGTVVFPHAELKLFVTADMDTRVQRRLLELQSNDIQVSEEDIRNNLIKRDHEETTRADSPLIKAADAIVIDNTNLTPAVPAWPNQVKVWDSLSAEFAGGN